MLVFYVAFQNHIRILEFSFKGYSICEGAISSHAVLMLLVYHYLLSFKKLAGIYQKNKKKKTCPFKLLFQLSHIRLIQPSVSILCCLPLKASAFLHHQGDKYETPAWGCWTLIKPRR